MPAKLEAITSIHLMRKKIQFLFLLVVAVSLYACVLQPKIQYYDLPEDIADEAKTENLKMIEKGRILYNINCAKCHNKKEKGRIILPEFTHAQLDAYTIRIKNEKHVNALPETLITPEELEAIQLFFAYKKPTNPAPGQ